MIIAVYRRSVKASKKLKKKTNPQMRCIKRDHRAADVTTTKEASFSDKKHTRMMKFKGEQISRGEKKQKQACNLYSAML